VSAVACLLTAGEGPSRLLSLTTLAGTSFTCLAVLVHRRR
jgi:hypothetical protein